MEIKRGFHTSDELFLTKADIEKLLAGETIDEHAIKISIKDKKSS
ncbi:hypothetical protein LCGC14_0619550 [marine sediment metagenome]|uniref:Uncharacterized protein n=1 Tax=marine sediment metagenome TaxID=412755 RepID=A0A0F9UDV8_9ZZZZ